MDDSEIERAVQAVADSVDGVSDAVIEAASGIGKALGDVGGSLDRIAHAVSPLDASPMTTPSGGRVGSLSEAVIYAAENMGRIADAISDLAGAVRELRDE